MTWFIYAGAMLVAFCLGALAHRDAYGRRTRADRDEIKALYKIIRIQNEELTRLYGERLEASRDEKPLDPWG